MLARVVLNCAGPNHGLGSMAEPDATGDCHLLVIAHGMWGSTRDVAFLARSLQERVAHTVVLVSQASRMRH
jgi:hypothetical protein